MEKNNRGIGFIIIILILGIIGIFVIVNNNKKEEVPSAASRIRIIASSDSKLDQSEKQKVKTKIIDYLNKTSDAYSLDEMKNVISTITTNFKIEEQKESFPAKSVNNSIIPSGLYPTVVITLGNGKGHNWWSVLYPEYFGLTYGDFDEIEYRSYIYDKLKPN